jgi:hypothetical protein
VPPTVLTVKLCCTQVAIRWAASLPPELVPRRIAIVDPPMK